MVGKLAAELSIPFPEKMVTEIVWLVMQGPAGREMKPAEIEALVMPAILAKRFHIEYA